MRKWSRKNRGRPSGFSLAAAVAHIHQLVIDHPSFVESLEEVEYIGDHATALACPLCLEVLDQPVELACDALACASCCCKWIEMSGGVTCPCYYRHKLDDLTVGLPYTVVRDLLHGPSQAVMH